MKRTSAELPKKRLGSNHDELITYVDKKRKILFKEEKKLFEEKIHEREKHCHRSLEEVCPYELDHSQCRSM